MNSALLKLLVNKKCRGTLIVLSAIALISCGGSSDSTSGNEDTATYSITNNSVQCPHADTYELGGTAITCYWECAVYKGTKGAVLLHFIKNTRTNRWKLDSEDVVADPMCTPYAP